MPLWINPEVPVVPVRSTAQNSNVMGYVRRGGALLAVLKPRPTSAADDAGVRDEKHAEPGRHRDGQATTYRRSFSASGRPACRRHDPVAASAAEGRREPLEQYGERRQPYVPMRRDPVQVALARRSARNATPGASGRTATRDGFREPVATRSDRVDRVVPVGFDNPTMMQLARSANPLVRSLGQHHYRPCTLTPAQQPAVASRHRHGQTMETAAASAAALSRNTSRSRR